MSVIAEIEQLYTFPLTYDFLFDFCKDYRFIS